MTSPLFCIWFWETFWKNLFFYYIRLSDLRKKLPFVLPEWQEVAGFFCGNQNKTSWRFIWALLDMSTLTNSMFPIAKTFFQQKSFCASCFYSDWLSSLQNQIQKPRQSLFRHFSSCTVCNFDNKVTQIAPKLYYSLVIC